MVPDSCGMTRGDRERVVPNGCPDTCYTLARILTAWPRQPAPESPRSRGFFLVAIGELIGDVPRVLHRLPLCFQ